MSNLTIEVVANPVSTVPTAKGSYQVIDLAYKNKSFQDKLEGKKIVEPYAKNIFPILSKAQFGDVFYVNRVKNDKGFWDWTSVSTDESGGDVPSASTGSPVASSPVKTGNVTPKSNYETAEERAARQVMIVRQSSLSTAVAMLEAAADKKTPINPDTVITVAKQFEAYVFGKDAVAPAIEETPPGNFFEDMEDDLP